VKADGPAVSGSESADSWRAHLWGAAAVAMEQRAQLMRRRPQHDTVPSMPLPLPLLLLLQLCPVID